MYKFSHSNFLEDPAHPAKERYNAVSEASVTHAHITTLVIPPFNK
jgi:hypothetical protein